MEIQSKQVYLVQKNLKSMYSCIIPCIFHKLFENPVYDHVTLKSSLQIYEFHKWASYA